MNKRLYYAVNASGQGCIFTTYPERDERRKIWMGQIIPAYRIALMQMEADGIIVLPERKWSDDPVAIEIEVKYL